VAEPHRFGVRGSAFPVLAFSVFRARFANLKEIFAKWKKSFPFAQQSATISGSAGFDLSAVFADNS
jgi:hypothetical protein